jgi:uncharacterized SAM-binding protein YcdF (DUF218 family)
MKMRVSGWRALGLSFSAIAVFGMGLSGIVALRINRTRALAPQPQAILMLGGDFDREPFTANFARDRADLPIWVSSGMPQPRSRAIFRAAGIDPKRLHFDNRAVDTVTNFTTLATDLKQRHIRHVYLLTSDFHMKRATAIATLVLGSQGIIFTPVAIPSNQADESWWRIARDSGRAVLWMFTGRTGASLNPRLPSSQSSLLPADGDSRKI